MEPTPAPAWLGALLLGVLCLSVEAWRRAWAAWRQGEPIVPRRRRRRVPWGAEGALLAAFSLATSLVVALSEWARPGQASTPRGFDLASVVAYLFTTVVFSFLAVGWILARYPSRRPTPGDFGLVGGPGQVLRDVGLGIAACAAMLPIVYAVQYTLVIFVGLPSSHPAIEKLLAEPTAETIAASVLMAVVIAPIYEEFAFRVLLQGWFERLGGRRAWQPVVVSSLAFAIAHTGQGWAPVPLFVFALGLGYVYRQTHRVVPVVAMHMAFNALGLAVAMAMAGQGVAVEGLAP